jgi:hypothetical protein
LKLNFQGNQHLDKNEVDQAIECYDKALPLSHFGQEGVLRVMRSTAYLQRSCTHFMQFKELVDQLCADPLPDGAVLAFLSQVHRTAPFMVSARARVCVCVCAGGLGLMPRHRHVPSSR